MITENKFYCTEEAPCYLHNARVKYGTGSEAERITFAPPTKGHHMQCLTTTVSRKGKAHQE